MGQRHRGRIKTLAGQDIRQGRDKDIRQGRGKDIRQGRGKDIRQGRGKDMGRAKILGHRGGAKLGQIKTLDTGAGKT